METLIFLYYQYSFVTYTNSIVRIRFVKNTPSQQVSIAVKATKGRRRRKKKEEKESILKTARLRHEDIGRFAWAGRKVNLTTFK